MDEKDRKGKTKWRIRAFYIDSCNCDWGCPCQFLARPTHGSCDGFGAFLIKKGRYGKVGLDNLSAVLILSYPGPVHEGHGKASYYVDDKADENQFYALSQILTGAAGGDLLKSMRVPVTKPSLRVELASG